jgi:hypothetical protein
VNEAAIGTVTGLDAERVPDQLGRVITIIGHRYASLPVGRLT